MEKTETLKNGKTITMKLTDNLTLFEIAFWESGEKLQGYGFEFEMDEDEDNYFLLKWMGTPYPRNGLGKKAIEFFLSSISGAIIWTRHPDDGPFQDGSELVNDGPEFVQRMQSIGLIAKWPGRY